MKVGILGAGFGAYHASLYKQNSSVEHVKIFSRSEEKLRGIKSDLGIEVTANINDILDDPSIDLIDVCLPNYLHKEYVVKALEKGKHVLCETPISMCLEDGEAILEAEKRYGKRVFINLFLRFDQPYKYIYDAIKNKKFGQLKTISVERKTAPVWGSLGYDKIATSLMIHDLDFVNWILGTPSEINAFGVSKNPNESYVNAFLSYADISAEVIGSSMMPKSYPFTVGYHAIFENGSIEYHEECTQYGDIKHIWEYSTIEKKEIELPQDNPYEKVIDHVVECCETDCETVIGAKEAVLSLRTAIKIMEIMKGQKS